jgi:hypothetical protein
VVGDGEPGRDVVLLVADVGGCSDEHVPRLAGREALQLGHVVLDHEATAGLQVRGRVAEAVNLAYLVRNTITSA